MTKPTCHLLLLPLLLGGCPGAPAPGDDDDATTPQAPTLPAFSPRAVDLPEGLCPIQLSAERPAAEPLGLLHLSLVGGGESNELWLESNPSGAIFNPGTGQYIAGTTTGVTDRVRARAVGCQGEATLAIDVVSPLSLRPTGGSVRPGDAFSFEVAGGTGEVEFVATNLRSGGSLDPSGAYLAGALPGIDSLTATDLGTGVSVQVALSVDPAATLVPRPPHLILPLGVEVELEVDGGSGWLDVQASGASVTLSSDGDVVTALASNPGRALLSAEDRFASLSTTVVVDVVQSQSAPLERGGHATQAGLAEGPGDLNGDGYPDALFALYESDVAAHRSGALYVYAGGPLGLEPAPAQVISWPDWLAELGDDFEVADLDGDGELDLMVGAPRADLDRSAQGLPPWDDGGALLIHMGLPGGFFEEQPSQILWADRGSDSFGKSVDSCDVNGDGVLDLVVGSRYDEDNNAAPVRSNQGSVKLFLGLGDGTFRSEPDQAVYGVSPDSNGDWIDDADQEFGYALAAGDIDGDGLCDLAVGSDNYASGSGRSRDGLVTLWRGQADDSNGAPAGGGFLPWPVRALTPMAPEASSGYFGRELELEDLDGDGEAELIVGQHRYTNAAYASSFHGAVRVYAGGALGTAPAALEPAASEAWIHAGDDSYDYTGNQFDLGDADGDGVTDLLIGLVRDEGNGSPNDAGGMRLFLGQAGGMPHSTEAWSIYGESGDGRMGLGLAVLGDVDGDGETDYFVHGGYEDLYGRDVGVPWYVSGADLARVPLDLPGEPSGHRFGEAATLAGDLNGDGYDDLAIGASESSTTSMVLGGSAFVYFGGPSGFPSAPSLSLDGFTGHSSADRFGYALAPAGDFDGDGFDDLAVVARYEDKPNAFSSAYVDPGDCPSGARNDVGAVYVFRGGDPMPSQPAFVLYGPQVSQRIDAVAGGADIDGNGVDDLLFSGWDWDASGAANAGGFAVVMGRPWSGGGIDVVCTPELLFVGGVAGDRVGRSVAMVGDTNDDGCDELAVGAYLADWTAPNEGAVHVVRGWGPGCPSEPTQAILVPVDSNDQVGTSLAGGGDVDGDGLPDLAVGAPWYYGDGANRGSAWVVPGAWMAAISYEPLHPQGVTITRSLWPIPGDKEDWRVPGGAGIDARSGNSVALVPGVFDGRAALVVGEPRGWRAREWSGGAAVYRWTESAGGPMGAMNPTPEALFVGELDPDGWAGDRLAGGLVDGEPTLLIGAPRSSAIGLDQGALWVAPLDGGQP